MELLGRELLADGLERAFLNACDQNAHIFGAAAQLLLCVASLPLKLWRPVTLFPQDDFPC